MLQVTIRAMACIGIDTLSQPSFAAMSFVLSEPRTNRRSFAIHPPIWIGDGHEIRSLADARARVRRYVRRSGDFIGMRLASLLDNARTAEEAELATEAFRHWAARGQVASQQFSKRNWRVGSMRKAAPRHA